ncbi:type II CAAX endopeptidase family protein [Abiotrophia defectiva]|uniref:CPBP family intramembrane glutamic endopeptidase n=1 Tax=Abiotrophia defectiva TaxID=46125 RepID=UPI0028E330AD|nr:type II CAAX endopeptidase family protein [Abiotrophia defectiva]
MSNKRTILLFVVLAYGLAWIIWLALWLSGVGLNSPWNQLASTVAMWMPALAVFILGKITNQPSGIKSKLVVNLKRNWRFYLLAIWLPAVISFLGAGLYFLVFPSNFSLGLESIQAILQEKGVSQSTIPLSSFALIQILASLTYAPFLNSFFALGEEIGWRGYLYPALRERFSIVQTHVLLGLIWSLWHLPINLQGYNYGLSYFAYPVLGVVAMFLFCFSLGILLSWLLAKTGSIWASALFHGAINATAGLGLLFQLPGQKALSLLILGPSPAGMLSVLPCLFLALLILQGERRKNHEFCK